MTALYLSLEVAWKLTPPCLGCSVPCQSLFWEVVRWYSGAWWASAGEDERSGLSCPTSAISVGWGLQKSRCWQKKPWWNSLQKWKHLPLAALCWLLSQDYQPWLSTGRSQPWSLWLMASTMHCSSLLCPSGWTLLLWSCLQLWGRDSGLWLRTKKSWWQHLETPATTCWVAVSQSLLALELHSTAPWGAVRSRRVLSSNPWHLWKLVGLAFICTKAKGNRGRSLSATNVKLLTNFQNVITSQLIKTLEKALDTFYRHSWWSDFCVNIYFWSLTCLDCE